MSHVAQLLSLFLYMRSRMSRKRRHLLTLTISSVQADGTAWMAFFCVTMLDIALELALDDPAYEDMASKFFEHFVFICHAINHNRGSGLWDEEDGFYYDMLGRPDGASSRLFPLASCPLDCRHDC